MAKKVDKVIKDRRFQFTAPGSFHLSGKHFLDLEKGDEGTIIYEDDGIIGPAISKTPLAVVKAEMLKRVMAGEAEKALRTHYKRYRTYWKRKTRRSQYRTPTY